MVEEKRDRPQLTILFIPIKSRNLCSPQAHQAPGRDVRRDPPAHVRDLADGQAQGHAPPRHQQEGRPPDVDLAPFRLQTAPHRKSPRVPVGEGRHRRRELHEQDVRVVRRRCAEVGFYGIAARRVFSRKFAGILGQNCRAAVLFSCAPHRPLLSLQSPSPSDNQKEPTPFFFFVFVSAERKETEWPTSRSTRARPRFS